MTRTERIPPNPNHYVGNHPLINSDQLDQYYPEPEDSRPVSPSPFYEASFHKGTVHWQPCPFSRVTVGGGFQEAVVINRGGISRLRCLSARRVTDIVVQVRIGSADGEPEWEYELHFSQDSRFNPRNDPYGGDFLEAVAQTPIKRRSSHLKRIRNALKVAVPQLAEIELTRDKRGSPHLRDRYEHWLPHGAWQTEDQFSDGTLRLMGLLWSAITGSGPLLLEEPELSLHPEVVRFIPQMFARVQRQLNRQIITSTHSSDLLRDEGIGLDEVLLLQPGENGTSVRPAKDFAEIHQLLNGGLSLAEAVLPMTRPQSES